ncbi:MAG: Hsp20/alpha crystallin family protein [Candidatus Sungbacteria bacterium]|nr:Hsp20/alpha crystallin family protein [Candidatus Sungbacteria bacterium]
MSTFFEKLTGSGQKAAAPPISASRRPGNTPPAVRRSPARAPALLSPDEEEHKIQPDTTTAIVQPSEDIQNQDGELFQEEEGELTVDIYDKGDTIVIQSTVAGVKPEDLDVSITSDVITIRGRRERTEEISEESYYYKELFWGTFSRAVILPEEIDENKTEAVLKHGLLTVTLPKKRKGIAQKLKVKTG